MAQYPTSIALGTMTQLSGYTFRTGNAADWFSFSVNAAGDVDGDGLADLLFGAPAGNIRENRPNPQVAAGETYLVLGGTSRLATFDAADGNADGIIDLSLLTAARGYTFSFGQVGDFSGQSVALVGNVDGVAGDDFLIGTPGTGNGRAHLISGGANLALLDAADGMIDGDIDLTLVDGATGFSIEGRASGDRAGTAVAGSPDLNGDGIGDIVVGAYLADQPGAANAGEAALIFGGATNLGAIDAADGTADGAITLSEIDGTNGYLLQGGVAGNVAGFAAEGIDDVDGDGIGDLIVGAFQTGSGLGEAYILFGGAAELAAADLDDGTTDGRINLAILDGTNGYRILSPDDGDQFGLAVSSAGDLNGDGIGDFVIGDPFSDPFTPASGSNNAGDAIIVFGGSTNLAALDAADGITDGAIDADLVNGTTGYRISGTGGEWAGFALDGGGDVNGDGFDDVIVTSNFRTTRTGATYVLFGGNGLAAQDAADGVADGRIRLGSFNGAGGFRLDGEDTEDQSGISAAIVGDIDNDGMADILVGSARDNSNAANSGDGEGYLFFSRDPDASVNRTGSNIAQTIVGSDFVDTLSGLGGDDILLGNNGADTLIGGTGNDTASYQNATAGLTARLFGPATNTGDAAGDSYNSVENLLGSRFNDTLVGDNNANILTGGSGNDTISALGGNDTLLGGAGNDTLTGGTGADAMTGGAGNDTYNVDDAGDTVTETAANGGSDTVIATVDFFLNDTNLQFVENVTLTGTGAIDASGNSLANRLTGNAGANELSGGAGADILNGLGGVDILTGGDGNDTFYVDNAADVVVEAAGATAGTADRVYASANYTLADDLEVESFLVSGTAGRALTGNNLANIILGNAGIDTLSGAGGNDNLNGGAGNDILNGGAGFDILNDSSGDNTFVFSASSDTAVGGQRDQIFGFGVGDKINLAAIDADVGNPGQDVFSFIGTSAFTAAGQLRYDIVAGTTIIQGNTGGTLAADFEIGLRNAYAPVAGDFILA